ncbi:hypothetical protein DFH27DRAFT_350346 [Peziza echinospora]|nr:hypothetical protein DFH27DRAFT_350346 [Peziza echinospora]
MRISCICSINSTLLSRMQSKGNQPPKGPCPHASSAYGRLLLCSITLTFASTSISVGNAPARTLGEMFEGTRTIGPYWHIDQIHSRAPSWGTRLPSWCGPSSTRRRPGHGGRDLLDGLFSWAEREAPCAHRVSLSATGLFWAAEDFRGQCLYLHTKLGSHHSRPAKQQANPSHGRPWLGGTWKPVSKR